MTADRPRYRIDGREGGGVAITVVATPLRPILLTMDQTSAVEFWQGLGETLGLLPRREDPEGAN